MKSSLNMSSEVTVDIHMVLSKQAAIPACAQEGSSGTGATRPQRMKSPRKEGETGENLQERDAKRGASSGRGSLPALSPSSHGLWLSPNFIPDPQDDLLSKLCSHLSGPVCDRSSEVMATFPKHYLYVSNLRDGRDFYLTHCKIIKQKAHQKTSRFLKKM